MSFLNAGHIPRFARSTRLRASAHNHPCIQVANSSAAESSNMEASHWARSRSTPSFFAHHTSTNPFYCYSVSLLFQITNKWFPHQKYLYIYPNPCENSIYHPRSLTYEYIVQQIHKVIKSVLDLKFSPSHDMGRTCLLKLGQFALLLALFINPEDGSSTLLRNAGKLLPDYMKSDPK
jgi:hypothetical protein